jgi:hypothetical protein
MYNTLRNDYTPLRQLGLALPPDFQKVSGGKQAVLFLPGTQGNLCG